MRAVLALPLLRDGRVIGALSLGDDAGRTFDAEALALARLFADHAATAFANAQLYTGVQAGQGRLQTSPASSWRPRSRAPPDCP